MWSAFLFCGAPDSTIALVRIDGNEINKSGVKFILILIKIEWEENQL